jgi:hypothetical protein
LERKIRGQI